MNHFAIDYFFPFLLSHAAVSELYVKHEFTADDKEVLKEIFENVKLALKASIRDNDWMSASTKKSAMEKAEAMIRRLGYPDYLDKKGAVDAFYAEYPVHKDRTFLETLLDWMPQQRKDFEKLRREKRSREKWSKENVAQV